VAGFSAGGLAAAHLALLHPGPFPNLVAISGAFHLTTRTSQLRPVAGAPAWLLERYERAERLPGRVYLAAGTFETAGIHAQSRALAGILRQRGVEVRFDTGPTGHDTVTARAHLAQGLAWLLANLVPTRRP
jgi:enterochelin esterase family protein